MFQVVNKQILGPDVRRLDILAPEIAEKIQPGQFVVIVPKVDEAWIPLSAVDADTRRGSFAIVFNEKHASTLSLADIQINHNIHSVIGPLGRPVKIKKFGTVVCAATGVATSQMISVAKALKKSGNRVIGVMGARTRKSLTLEPQMRIACEKVIIATEDGSFERRGLASSIVREVMDQEPVHHIFASGSIEMFEEICAKSREKSVATSVHLPLPLFSGLKPTALDLVDVDGELKSAAFDGPFFDGFKVDYDNLRRRLRGQFGHDEEHFPVKDQMVERAESIARFFTGMIKGK